MKRCWICREEKEVSQFHRRGANGYQSHCKDCNAKSVRARYLANPEYYQARNRANRRRNAEWLLEYLRQHPCVDCGEADPVVLDFDHVRGVKQFTLAHLTKSSYGLDAIKAEVEKCDVRCANCHRRKTARELGYFRTLQQS